MVSYAGDHEISPGVIHRRIPAGDLLYSFRGEGGRPFPLRPRSKTEFFWEGLPATVAFEFDSKGMVVAMLVDADGYGQDIERAPKVQPPVD